MVTEFCEHTAKIWMWPWSWHQQGHDPASELLPTIAFISALISSALFVTTGSIGAVFVDATTRVAAEAVWAVVAREHNWIGDSWSVISGAADPTSTQPVSMFFGWGSDNANIAVTGVITPRPPTRKGLR
jgi:hypothetical protein